MPKHKVSKPTAAEYQNARAIWSSIKAPDSMHNIGKCVSAFKVIASYTDAARDSKYDKANNLRIVFSRTGTVTYYSQFPAKKGLKGMKLGTYPEMHYDTACKQAKDQAEGHIQAHTVHMALDLYQEDLKQRINGNNLKPRSFVTYCCRIKKLKTYFHQQERLIGLRLRRVYEVTDKIIENETNTYAIELFAELRRFTEFASKFTDGVDTAATLPKNYVSARVSKPTPTELYMLIEDIAELWINANSARSLHQKNALHFMILSGLRPHNVCEMRLEWLDSLTTPTQITFPGARDKEFGFMKSGREFILPLSTGMQEILLEQINWIKNAFPDGDCQYVFLKPSNPTEPFSPSTLNSNMKQFSPVNCLHGKFHENTVKGSAGPFCTALRKFVKSNMTGHLLEYLARLEAARSISAKALDHSLENLGMSLERYDFSEKMFKIYPNILKDSFQIHYDTVMKAIDIASKRPRKLTGGEAKKEENKHENTVKTALRAKIKQTFGKTGYSAFINSKLPGTNTTVREHMLVKSGRDLIEQYLSA